MVVDKFLARTREKRLEEDVHDAMAFLFDEHHGHMVRSQGVPLVPQFDYAFVTIAVGGLLIRLCRGRGELDVRIASEDAPDDSHELSLVLSLIEDKKDLQRWGVVDLWDASRLMESRMHLLKSVFVGSAGRELKRRLAEVYANDKLAIRQAEWEIIVFGPGHTEALMKNTPEPAQ